MPQMSPTVVPELKAYESPDLEYGKLPMRSDDCEVRMEAAIGVPGDDRADMFYFTVVTPRTFLRSEKAMWGRGYLVIKRFSWPDVERALLRLLGRCRAPTWELLAVMINRDLIWEHDFEEEAES